MGKEIQFLLYSLPDESGQVQVVIKDETLWCTQKAMAALFNCSTDNIGIHLKNVYAEGELNKEATTEKISVVQKEGERDVNRTPIFYNLDAIIAVGYRVSSAKATKFRQWATKVLGEYIRKGFVLDDDRLSETTRDFYAMVQNRFHYAITGQTAAEIIYTRADHAKDHMGLTTWKNAPDGRVLKMDVTVAKNYLSEGDIRKLERTVPAYFDKEVRSMLDK